MPHNRGKLPGKTVHVGQGLCRSPPSTFRPPRAAFHLETKVNARIFGQVPQVCFDRACQEAADQAFLVALAVPIAVFVASVYWLLRSPAPSASVFKDPDTGAVFEAHSSIHPARDAKGQLAYRVSSYTPVPAEDSHAGQRVRINVGPVGRPQPRTFLFDAVLPSPSAILTVTLPRPLGVLLEEDRRSRRAVVADLAPGSGAAQRAALARFDRARRTDAALPGDILRAVTATNLVYPAKSLVFGMAPPERHIVLFGADQQGWEKVAAALKSGLAEDGPVTLVLERQVRDD